MNRLIIVGNGFDLAHGLPTSYKNFLSWYWTTLSSSMVQSHGTYTYQDFFIKLNIHDGIKFQSLSDLERLLDRPYYERGKHYAYLNDFFLSINRFLKEVNWVDIEMAYKESLELIFRTNHARMEDLITDLNKEFEEVRQLFRTYLVEEIDAKVNSEIYLDSMHRILNSWRPTQNFSNDFFSNPPKHLTHLRDMVNNDLPFHDLDGKTYILCFNYTNTVNLYISEHSRTIVNQIHGSYRDNNNPIVFGYGDESDELFPELEKANKNHYLEFTKSSSYLHSINYTTLMSFIDSDEFFVEVLGHSMALSDRTLLKGIFENENCKYIFMHYHQRDDNTDDFFDKAINIGRHFTDKNMLRRKVAPKAFCMPLPQCPKDK
ncbi:AbiH family protein [Flavobacterium silvaticum]|uniref:Bacteriophage abortive infection AbiH n=1 Tax=Flavobacterium silvaticum TaxID=1852020 RepID=A0A972FLS0_9FLAO|nr:AbiH family protein [Flavobacterium silvaticum]NMH28068.1 hypothetical protein [Flavobacterium silvaticum]